jgi:DNA mismatch endonuclease (patch repair protein)
MAARAVKKPEAAPSAGRDRLSPERRSWNMSQIGSKDTQPELIVRRLITEMGLRYRLHRRDLPGKPDIVFGPRRLVLFVHGCFWHRHRGCRMASTPSANAAFWQTKFDANTARDRRNTTVLKRAGWRVAVIWECETRQPERLARRLQRLLPVVSVSA